MPNNNSTRIDGLRLTLTEALREADRTDALAALHIAAAIGALNASVDPGARNRVLVKQPF